MANPYEVLVTEINATEVNYDLSRTPKHFIGEFGEETVAFQALRALGCTIETAGVDLHVILPEDVEAACEQASRPSLERDSLTDDVDFLVLGGIRQFAQSGRPSDISTRIVEGTVALSKQQITVRRHATYRSLSVA